MYQKVIFKDKHFKKYRILYMTRYYNISDNKLIYFLYKVFI